LTTVLVCLVIPAVAVTPPPLADPSDLADRFRAAGLKATPQRVAILRALLGVPEHPSPEEVYRLVAEEMPSISLGTIYKTLDALEGAGMVSQVALLNETKRYDANQSPHHHLICTSCRRIVDFTDPSLDGIEPPNALSGFTPHELKVQILGICDRCAKEE